MNDKMKNKEFIAELAERSNLSTNETQSLVNDLVSEMTQCFGEGKNIAIQGFGIFEVKKKLERVIVNPTTRKRMLVPPKLVLTFKPSSNLKEKTRNRQENNGDE
mgnify:CR=1 FL=1